MNRPVRAPEPAPAAVVTARQVRVVALVAAVAWVSVHTGFAVGFAGQHREPLVLAAAILLALVVCGAAVAPLILPVGPLRRGGALVMAGGSVLVAALVQPFLSHDGLAGRANWPMGGLSVVLASLCLRRRAEAALLAVTGMTAVNAGATWAAHDAGFALDEVAATSVTPWTWLVAACLLRGWVNRPLAMAEGYRRRGVADEAQATAVSAVAEADARRREELRADVLPLLRRLAQDPLTEELRAEAASVAGALRDDLRARTLLSRELRDHVAAARARGVEVSLSSESGIGADEPALVATRTVLSQILAELPSGAQLTCRVTASPPTMLLSVTGADPDALHRWSAWVTEVTAPAHVDPRVDPRVDIVDGELLAHVRWAPTGP